MFYQILIRLFRQPFEDIFIMQQVTDLIRKRTDCIKYLR